MEILSGLENQFASDPEVKESVEKERVGVRNCVEETLRDQSDEEGEERERPRLRFGDYPRPIEHEVERSIFDDIDL